MTVSRKIADCFVVIPPTFLLPHPNEALTLPSCMPLRTVVPVYREENNTARFLCGFQSVPNLRRSAPIAMLYTERIEVFGDGDVR